MTRVVPTNAGHTKWSPEEELSVQRQQGDTNNSYGTLSGNGNGQRLADREEAKAKVDFQRAVIV
jgi:hypothetical protein